MVSQQLPWLSILKRDRCGLSTLSSTATRSRSRRLLLSRQPPPTRQSFAARLLLHRLPSTQPSPTCQPPATPQLLPQLPLTEPPPTRHPSAVRQLLLRLPPTRLLLHPLLLQPSATPLLRRWKPFVCRPAGHRGLLTTASLPLLHHRLLPTSMTLHVRQRPSLQPPTLLTIYLDPRAPTFSPKFISTPPSTATYPSVSVLLPVNAISTSNPDPYAIDGDEPKCDEFSRGRPPEFELDKETQLKVPASSPSLKELELPEHVNVLFLQIVEDIDLPDDTVQDLKSLLYDHRDTFASSSTDLGYCPLVEHDIDSGDSRPIKQSPRRPPIAAREVEDEMFRRDVGNRCD